MRSEELVVELGEANHGLEYFFNRSPEDLGDALGEIHSWHPLASFDLGHLVLINIELSSDV